MPHYPFLVTEVRHSLEIELLLCCAQTHIDKATSERIKSILEQPIDWTVVITIATEHGIIPLLYQNLQLIQTAAIPNKTLDFLYKSMHGIALHNIFFTKELLKILDLFEKNSILALPFKGPTLAMSIYNNLGLRDFCDLDILVPSQDFLSAFDLLATQGYYPTYQWDFLNRDFELAVRQSKGEYSFSNGIICIDLHQRLTVEKFMSSRFTFDYLWERRQPIILSGKALYSFGPEDLLMYLCIHGSKDCWRKLKWICDVAECMQRSPDRDWEQFLLQSATMGCERTVLLGLLLTHQVLGVNLPDIVTQQIKANPVCQTLAQDFGKRLFQADNTLSKAFTFQKFIRHWQMTETRRDRIACILDIGRPIRGFWLKCLPNVNDRDFLALPQYLYFLYYLIRPLRLGLKHFNRAKKP